jgi:hypothetical protein
MIRCAKGSPKDKPYEEASNIATTMGNTTTSAAPGRCKLVAGKTSINSKTTTATTTTPARVENVDIDSDVDDSDNDLKPAATSESIWMIADDEFSHADTTTDMKDLSPDLNWVMSQELQHGATAAAAIELVDDDDDDDYAPPDWAHTDGREVTDSNTSETNNNESVVPSPSQTRPRFPPNKSATRHLELTENYIPNLHRKPAAAAPSPKPKTNRQGRRPPKGNNKRKYFTSTDMKDLSPDLSSFMSQELEHGATAAAAIDLVDDDDDDDDDDDYASPDWAYRDGREVTDSTTSENNNNESVVPSPSQTRPRFPATKSATRHLELTENYIPKLHRKPAAAAPSPKTKTNSRGRPPKGNNKRKYESQKEKDELVKVGDVVYAPYPGKCPLKESKYPIDLCATIVRPPNLHKLLRIPLIC